ncbi:MAG: tetratricopeptide repeat protein [Succinivibrionaceae bacterium]
MNVKFLCTCSFLSLMLLGCNESSNCHKFYEAKNYEQALNVCPKADDGLSNFYVAEMYYNGNGVAVDKVKGIEFYKKASDMGNVRASYKLGEIYYIGEDVNKDYKIVFEEFSKGAAQGDYPSIGRLGLMYLNGQYVEKDKIKGFDMVLKAANAGVSNAQIALYVCYNDEIAKIYPNIDKLHYLQMAADNGDSVALSLLIPQLISENKHEEVEKYSKILLEAGDLTNYSIISAYYMLTNDYPMAFKYYKVLAEHDDAEALYIVGLEYNKGELTILNKEKALELITKSADKGYLNAKKWLGVYYTKDNLDNRKAVEYLKQLQGTEVDDINIDCFLGYNYNILNDKNLAYKYLKSGMEKYGHCSLEYINFLINEGMYEELISVANNIISDEKYNSEEKSYAFYSLYKAYSTGEYGVAKDEKKAVFNLEQAVKVEPNKYGLFNYHLAFLYEEGKLVKKDLNKAFLLYKAAVNSPNPIKYAKFNLADMYLEGRGTKKDVKQAISILEEISNNENSIYSEENSDAATFELCRYYFLGFKGVQKNYSKAFNYCKKLADKNDVLSSILLGEMYKKGLGTNINLKKSFSYFKIAADQNEPLAMFNVGHMYMSGIGVDKNRSVGRFWICESSKLGYKEAKQYLENNKYSISCN